MSDQDENLAVTLTIKQLRLLMRESARDGARDALDARPTTASKRYIDARELATHYDVSRATVHNWTSKEGCPHLMRGKVMRFELAAVEAWFRGRDAGLRRVK